MANSRHAFFGETTYLFENYEYVSGEMSECNKSGIYPGASPGQNVVHFVVTGLFPLKKPATPPRAVLERSCERTE
ncbi:MAG: hypothetical protein A2V96_01500 [Candidatus Yonathbacteria bacterium RBG_16_43_6]|uniref:Uncharacterized protein n=1 Tax=Candidatus Yonathbacteria bacterium RIFCSPLOWO2_01_FULL_43_27 TaxID=1802726 RepID=A0A1G2SD76_9BACT|nr:MAG: hypothetical protein A2658_01625 [Candidatus Yonathbacteria bacterium RIFCSPHIGHO2_01_FULL_44_19]OHA79459.1 MAG: hypothetical protein A2V96_01500 [Candidatus Yonathbacteria bacterium RBG_16_43_6]OHA82652.1 MAG: hypothetical protein A3B07_01825 [Candidatus Yonathbacteria bacterium RIFCSPLOWO2_01_FULL_43_27]